MLVQLREGCSVVVRPVSPADEPFLTEACAGLRRRSSNSFTDDHEVVGAFDPLTGQGVGVACFVRDPARRWVAEAAVAVVDDWTARGLGSVLLSHLIRRARRHGIEVFSAAALREGEPIEVPLDEAQRVLSTAARASASYGLPA